MGISYTVEEILHVFDTQLLLVLLAGAVVFVGAYGQYLEAIRLGFKHRTHAIPWFANMFFFAHDIVFVLLFDRWFNQIGHWLYQVFWIALIIFTLFECVVHYQTLRYSREELFPNLTPRQYWVVYILLQVLVALLFAFIYAHLNDPLFLISFAITEVISNVFNIPMLLRRGSRKGQSFFLAGWLLLGSCLGYFFLFGPLVHPLFRTPLYIAVGIIIILLNVTHVWLMTRFPAHQFQGDNADVDKAEGLGLQTATGD